MFKLSLTFNEIKKSLSVSSSLFGCLPWRTGGRRGVPISRSLSPLDSGLYDPAPSLPRSSEDSGHRQIAARRPGSHHIGLPRSVAEWGKIGPRHGGAKPGPNWQVISRMGACKYSSTTGDVELDNFSNWTFILKLDQKSNKQSLILYFFYHYQELIQFLQSIPQCPYDAKKLNLSNISWIRDGAQARTCPSLQYSDQISAASGPRRGFESKTSIDVKSDKPFSLLLSNGQ